jgi:hypothetical protein
VFKELPQCEEGAGITTVKFGMREYTQGLRQESLSQEGCERSRKAGGRSELVDRRDNSFGIAIDLRSWRSE